MGSGGSRPGAGRPRKSREDRIIEGKEEMPQNSVMLLKAKEIPIEVIEANMPEVEDYMKDLQRDGRSLDVEKELKKVFLWVAFYGCEKQVPGMLLEQYAMNRARWKSLQRAVSEYGYVSKKSTSNNVQVSPFMTTLIEIEKQINATYLLIRQIVKENCVSGFQDYRPDDDEMEKILRKQGV